MMMWKGAEKQIQPRIIIEKKNVLSLRVAGNTVTSASQDLPCSGLSPPLHFLCCILLA